MQKLFIRFFDLLFSITALIILSPIFLLLAIIIKTESSGDIFFIQDRVGKQSKIFKLIKFRSMHSGADKKGLITAGQHSSSITNTGKWMRKYKLDELPQLVNVIKNEMSIVGPRPEVKKYIDLYNPEQKMVLTVKPGITDFASIEFVDENELLSKTNDPNRMYIEEIMPAKLKLNMKYINRMNLKTYFTVILLTIKKLVS